MWEMILLLIVKLLFQMLLDWLQQRFGVAMASGTIVLKPEEREAFLKAVRARFFFGRKREVIAVRALELLQGNLTTMAAQGFGTTPKEYARIATRGIKHQLFREGVGK